jgi:hypothetical protein
MRPKPFEENLKNEKSQSPEIRGFLFCEIF